MALSPQHIRETTFKSTRKGYDPAEVEAFVEEVAAALESAQNEATAMEARARAAVARLQELSQHAGDTPGAGAGDVVKAKPDEAETISRTLLLAQRTADTTIAEAQAEADRLLASARDDAAAALDAARAEAEALLEAAKADARRAGEAERVQVEGEVQALLARRDFLESDVDHLEQYLVAQRERIVEAVASLNDLVQRVPGGLGDMRRPLLSAAAEPEADADVATAVPSEDGPADAGSDDGAALGEHELDEHDEHDEIAEITRVAAAQGRDDGTPPAGTLFGGDGGEGGEGGDPTEQMAAVERREP